jgi:carbon-monoxide dehydrogenase small subunit
MRLSGQPTLFDLEVTVNGRLYRRTVPTHLRLLDFLREALLLTGTKEACGEGECGSCTVLMNGLSVNCCLVLAVEAQGAEIVTIEGLAQGDTLNALQQAFVDCHAVQCGYCIPGMVLSAGQLLEDNPRPSRDEIESALVGNICRCTGYHKIIDAVEQAAGGGA